MASATPPASSVKFDEAQGKTLRGLSLYTLLFAGALGLLGLGKIVFSVVLFLAAPLNAVLGLVEGGLLAVVALILIKASSDVNYVREVPQLASAHLQNAVTSWRDFGKFIAGVGAVALLVALLRFAF